MIKLTFELFIFAVSCIPAISFAASTPDKRVPERQICLRIIKYDIYASYPTKAFYDLSARALIHNINLTQKTDSMEQNPLTQACSMGNLDAVLALVKIGKMPVNHPAKLSGALHHASAGGHGDVVTYLLKRQANPNAVDQYGQTPLIHAFLTLKSDVQTADITRLLMAAKADTRPDQKGLDAFKYATILHKPISLQVLRDHSLQRDAEKKEAPKKAKDIRKEHKEKGKTKAE